MTQLADIATFVRSKNAGPFWLTIDIFCESPASYARVRDGLSVAAMADLFQMPPDDLKRFDIASLNVVKISLPRPVVQGSRLDRDMHGAQWAMLAGTLELLPTAA